MAAEKGLETVKNRQFQAKIELKQFKYVPLTVTAMHAYPASTPSYESRTYEYYEHQDFMEWIKKRGLSKEALDYAQALQWFQGLLTYEGCLDGFESPHRLAIPIMDDRERLLGFEFRKYNGFGRSYPPKVQYNSGCQNKFFVWNQHDWIRHQQVFVGEGILDGLRLYDYVGSNIGATYGASISRPQLEILAQLPKLVWVADRDAAGLKATLEVCKWNRNCEVLIPWHKDVGEDNDFEIKDSLENRIVTASEFVEEVDHKWFTAPDDLDQCQYVQFKFEE